MNGVMIVRKYSALVIKQETNDHKISTIKIHHIP